MREKLIELIGQVQDEGRDYSDVVCVYPTSNKRLADHLIANGVTIQKWIPVAERLPEEDCEVVLVFGKRGGIYTAEFHRKDKWTWFHKLNSKNHYCEPTHWMPLPEPPMEERKDND